MAPDSSLQRDIDALGVFPRMSLLNGRTEIQRGEEYEVIYTRKAGSRTYSGSLYRQYVANAAITMATHMPSSGGGGVGGGTSAGGVGDTQKVPPPPPPPPAPPSAPSL